MRPRSSQLAIAPLLAVVATMLVSPTTAPTRLGTIIHQDAPDAIPGRYLVVLQGDPLAPRLPDVSGTADRLVRRYGGTVGRRFAAALLGFTLTASERQAAAIAGDPAVRFVEQDTAVRPVEPLPGPVIRPDNTQTNAPWHLSAGGRVRRGSCARSTRSVPAPRSPRRC